MALINTSLDGNYTFPALESTSLLTNSVTDSPSQNGRNGTLCFMHYCDEGLDDLRRQIEDYVRPAWYEWIVVIVYILTFMVGLTGNVLVCFAVWRNRQMRTITNMFIVNLSVADLGILIICLPPTLLVDVTETWFMGLVMCKLVYFLMTVSVSVSVLTLAAIAVERWYAICRPLSFKSTRKRARIIIIVIWIISCCFAVPDLLFMQVNGSVPDFVSTWLVSCRPNWDKQTIYQIACIILLYLLPMIFIGFAYIQIAFVLWKGDIPGENKARTGSTRPMMNSEKMNVANEQLAARRKAAQMLISVVVAFAVCYFPVHLLNILRYADAHLSIPENGFRAYNYIAHWLPYLNSSTNPIIYNFMSAKFRKEFLQACRCSYRITGKNMSRPGTTFSSTHYSGHYSTQDGHRPSCQTEHISLTAVR